MNELVATVRALFEMGLSPGTSGNLSARAADGFLLTPTNAALGALDPERLSRLDRDGRHVGGDTPTKEWRLHLALYERRPGAQAVVHLHSAHAVAVSCLDGVDPDNVVPPLTPYFVMRVGRVVLVPYARPGSDELVTAVRERAGEDAALLLANHGPLVTGASLAQAAAAAVELEEAARLMLLLEGRHARPLTPEQVAELRQPPTS